MLLWSFQQRAKEKAREMEVNRRRLLIQAQQLIRTGTLRDELDSVQSSLQIIEECFTLLFPGHDIVVVNTAVADSADEDVVEEIDWNSMEWVSSDSSTELEHCVTSINPTPTELAWDGVPTTHTLPFTIVS
jgi:hypothetical protein